MSIQNKNLIAIVSTNAGQYITTWPKIDFGGFSKEINGGPSECVIKLPVAFDYGGSDLYVGNSVEIRISDKDTVSNSAYPDGTRKIYEGYISLIERESTGAKESVIVHILGHYTKLAIDILKNAAQTKLYSDTTNGITTSAVTAADIGLMMRALLDRYIAENTNPKIGYDSANIANTGTTAEYTFQQKTYREAMDKLRLLAPAGYFYYIDENGQVSFKAKPSTPTHSFIFGRHFNSVKVEQSLEKARNIFLVWDGQASGTYKQYKDDDSIASYGRRVQNVTDNGIGNSAAADAIGATLLAQSKNPEIILTCTILDNNESDNFGYDIESIQPGDTCSFFGFDSSLSDIFQENMLITNVNYDLDKVQIKVEVIKSGLVDIQEQQGKQLKETVNTDLPASYT